MLAPIDYIIVALYIVITIGIGFYISKKASANIQAYFLGGNSLKWYWLGFSNSSGMFDISGTAFYVSLLFVYGLKSVWLTWMWPIWNQIAVMMFLAVWIRRSGVMTGAEWIHFRFGNNKGARLAHATVVAFASIAVIFFIGYIFAGIGKFASSFFPTTDLSFAIGSISFTNEQSFALIVIALTALYSIKGGMFSVVATEVLQYGLMIACSILVAYLAFTQTDGASIKESLTENWQSLTPKNYLGATWQNLPASNVKIEEDGFSFFTIMLLLMIGKGVFASLAGPVPGFDMQRILSTKTNKDAALMSGFTALVLYIPLFLLIAGFTALGIKNYKNNYSQPTQTFNAIAQNYQYNKASNTTSFMVLTKDSVQPASILKVGEQQYAIAALNNIANQGTSITINGELTQIPNATISTYQKIDFEKLLSDVIANKLPIGVKGLVIAGLLAAFMSTFSAFVNAAPAYVVNDLYKKHIKPNMPDKHYVNKSYQVSLLMIVLGTIIGLSGGSLSALTIWITSSLYGGYAASNFLKWIWWRFNGWGYFLGMLSGLIISTLFYFWKQNAAPSEFLSFANSGVGSLVVFFIMLAIVVLACVLGSKFTTPTDMPALQYFYAKTNPWGWWKPVHQFIKSKQTPLNIPLANGEVINNENFTPNKELKQDLFNVAIGIVWQMSMMVMPIYLVFTQWTEFWTALITFAITSVIIYFSWYKKLRND
jgi:solute:Na+ symporter, SSS family